MLRLLFGAAIIAVCASSANAEQGCTPRPKALAWFSAAAKAADAQIFLVQDADKVSAFMEVANKVPPETHFAADAVVGLAKDSNIIFGLFRKSDDMICGPIKLEGKPADDALKAGGVVKGTDL